jgi:plastocyanin
VLTCVAGISAASPRSKVRCFAPAALALFILAGCGGGDEADLSAAGPRTVVMTDYAFHPRNVDARRGQTVTVLNEGETAHNLKVERGPDPRRETDELAGTPSFMKGDREQLRIDLPPGRYVMVCSVPGHRELGMTGRLTVR